MPNRPNCLKRMMGGKDPLQRDGPSRHKAKKADAKFKGEPLRVDGGVRSCWPIFRGGNAAIKREATAKKRDALSRSLLDGTAEHTVQRETMGSKSGRDTALFLSKRNQSRADPSIDGH